MQAVKGQRYGRPSTRLEALPASVQWEPERALPAFDVALQERVLAMQRRLGPRSPFELLEEEEEAGADTGDRDLLLFFMVITCCHSLLVEKRPEVDEDEGEEEEGQQPPTGSRIGLLTGAEGQGSADPPRVPAPAPAAAPEQTLGIGPGIFWPMKTPPSSQQPWPDVEGPEPTDTCAVPAEEAQETRAPWSYTGPSPDEVALVTGATQLGFVFVSRGLGSLTLDFMGHRRVGFALPASACRPSWHTGRRAALRLVQVPSGDP